MREIKFQFIYKGLPYSAENKEFNWHKKVYSVETLISERLPEICDVHNTCELIAVREYTGLKDKNGTEIYEGDIVEWSEVVREQVFYNELHAGFETPTSMLCHYSMKVIGNIYENPEL